MTNSASVSQTIMRTMRRWRGGIDGRKLSLHHCQPGTLRQRPRATMWRRNAATQGTSELSDSLARASAGSSSGA
jgi:hypothetical protein